MKTSTKSSTSMTFQFYFVQASLFLFIYPSCPISLPLYQGPNMKSEDFENVTALKFENRTRTQSRTSSPI